MRPVLFAACGVIALVGSVGAFLLFSANSLEEIVIFLEPDLAVAERENLQAELEAQSSVLSVRYISQEAAHECFLEMYADRPALTENVDASILPPSLRLNVATRRDADAIKDLYLAHPGVEEIVILGHASPDVYC